MQPPTLMCSAAGAGIKHTASRGVAWILFLKKSSAGQCVGRFRGHYQLPWQQGASWALVLRNGMGLVMWLSVLIIETIDFPDDEKHVEFKIFSKKERKLLWFWSHRLRNRGSCSGPTLPSAMLSAHRWTHQGPPVPLSGIPPWSCSSRENIPSDSPAHLRPWTSFPVASQRWHRSLGASCLGV